MTDSQRPPATLRGCICLAAALACLLADFVFTVTWVVISDSVPWWLLVSWGGGGAAALVLAAAAVPPDPPGDHRD